MPSVCRPGVELLVIKTRQVRMLPRVNILWLRAFWHQRKVIVLFEMRIIFIKFLPVMVYKFALGRLWSLDPLALVILTVALLTIANELVIVSINVVFCIIMIIVVVILRYSIISWLSIHHVRVVYLAMRQIR